MSVLLLAFLSLDPQCQRPDLVVHEAQRAAVRYDVPATVILAAVMAETGCRNSVLRREWDGRCDIGLAQIHANCAEKRFYLDYRNNLTRAAEILSWSSMACSTRLRRTWQCKQTEWARYNWHSRSWRGSFRRWLRRLEDAIREKEGEV